MTDGPIQLKDFLYILPDAAETKVCWRKPVLSKNVLLLACVGEGLKGPQSPPKAGFKYNPQVLVLVDVALSPRGAG